MGSVENLINEKTIDNRVEEIANELYSIYGDKEVVFVSILKGSVFFTCDLLKRYKGDARLEFLRVSSYQGTESTGEINLSIKVEEDKIKGKDVIIVEDIIDTGYTLNYLKEYISNMQPKSLKICALLDKKERREVDIDADYVGFSIDDLFVVGYGLDYDQKYRNLPYIGVYKKTKKLN